MDRIIFSASSLSKSVSCPRAYALTWRVRLRKRTTERYFILGRVFHNGIAAYYSTGSLREALTAVRTTLNEEAAELDAMDTMEVGAEAERLITSYAALAEVEDQTINLTPIAVENRFAYKLPNKDCEAYVVGMIDLYASTSEGHTLVDHKTAASVGAAYFRNAQHDPQAGVYCAAAKQLGIEPKIFMWNVISKTKTPYLKREWYIPSPARIQRILDELSNFASYIAQLPTDPLTILKTVPGNVGACRGCPFIDMCESVRIPNKGEEIVRSLLEQEYTVSTYERFGL